MANFEAPCPAPTVVNGREPASCVEGATILHNTQCTPLCAVYYATADPVMHCSHGIMTPSTFSCSLVRYVPPRWTQSTAAPESSTTTTEAEWTVPEHWAATTCGVLIAIIVTCSFLVVVRATFRTKRKGRSKIPQSSDEYDEDDNSYDAEVNEPEPVTRAPQTMREKPKVVKPVKPTAPVKQTPVAPAAPVKKPTPAPKQAKAVQQPAKAPAPSPRQEPEERDRHGHYDIFG